MDMRYLPLCVMAFAALHCKGEAPEAKPATASPSDGGAAESLKLATPEAGKVTSLTGTVSAKRGNEQERPLQVGASVFEEDLVKTTVDSRIGITFNHNQATWDFGGGLERVVVESEAWTAKTADESLFAAGDKTETAGAGRDSEGQAAEDSKTVSAPSRSGRRWGMASVVGIKRDEREVSDGEEAPPPAPKASTDKRKRERQSPETKLRTSLSQCGTLGGPIELRFKLSKAGRVSLSDIKGIKGIKSKALRRCVKKAASSVELGPQDEKTEISVTITELVK